MWFNWSRYCIFMRTYFWCRLRFNKQKLTSQQNSNGIKSNEQREKKAIRTMRKNWSMFMWVIVRIYLLKSSNSIIRNRTFENWWPVAVNGCIVSQQFCIVWLSTKNISCELPLWFDGIVPNVIIFELSSFMLIFFLFFLLLSRFGVQTTV